MRRPVISNFDHLTHAHAELLLKTTSMGSPKQGEKARTSVE